MHDGFPDDGCRDDGCPAVGRIEKWTASGIGLFPWQSSRKNRLAGIIPRQSSRESWLVRRQGRLILIFI
jgi:hypothetical protein